MNTTCTRCGAPLRPGRAPAQCERCRPVHAAHTGGEDSGLIDIRMLPTLAGPVRPVTPIPTFGGLAGAGPRIAEPPAPRPPAPRARPSQTPLHVLIGVLVFGVVGLAGAVVHSANRSPDAPSIVEIVETVETVEPVARAPRPISTDDAAPAEVPTKPAATAPAESPIVDKPPAHRKPHRAPAHTDKPEAASATPKPAPVAVKEPAAVDERESVACLLDPGKCGGKREAAAPAPAPIAGSDLPAKLEPADISEGTRAAKASATSRCSALAKGGETVKIKLSIAGPTGAVLGTSLESDGGNASLASCCADELKAAHFRSVQKQQIGAVVTLKF